MKCSTSVSLSHWFVSALCMLSLPHCPVPKSNKTDVFEKQCSKTTCSLCFSFVAGRYRASVCFHIQSLFCVQESSGKLGQKESWCYYQELGNSCQRCNPHCKFALLILTETEGFFLQLFHLEGHSRTSPSNCWKHSSNSQTEVIRGQFIVLKPV